MASRIQNARGHYSSDFNKGEGNHRAVLSDYRWKRWAVKPSCKLFGHVSHDMSSYMSSPDFFGWLPSLLGKMATAMCNAARYVLIRKFNFEGAKKRLFHSFGIKDTLVKRLANLRIEKPTAIQEKVSYV